MYDQGEANDSREMSWHLYQALPIVTVGAVRSLQAPFESFTDHYARYWSILWSEHRTMSLLIRSAIIPGLGTEPRAASPTPSLSLGGKPPRR